MSCSCAADKGGGDELGEDSTGLYDPEMEEEKLCGSIAANSLVSRSCKLKLWVAVSISSSVVILVDDFRLLLLDTRRPALCPPPLDTLFLPFFSVFTVLSLLPPPLLLEYSKALPLLPLRIFPCFHFTPHALHRVPAPWGPRRHMGVLFDPQYKHFRTLLPLLLLQFVATPALAVAPPVPRVEEELGPHKPAAAAAAAADDRVDELSADKPFAGSFVSSVSARTQCKNQIIE